MTLSREQLFREKCEMKANIWNGVLNELREKSTLGLKSGKLKGLAFCGKKSSLCFMVVVKVMPRY